MRWLLRSRELDLSACVLVMGIVNVTPDSFSDGGRHATVDSAIEHALQLLADGADIIDVGGESTRPGSPAATSDAICTREEQRRVLPVIEGILRQRPSAVVSIDTYRAATARLAVQAGAQIVNDVSGLLWDDAMAVTLAELRCGVVLMHTRGLPSAWPHLPPIAPGGVVPLVRAETAERLAHALSAGIDPERIILDPGFGFGKRGDENAELLTGMAALQQLGRPLLAGLSRKGFLAPNLVAEERDAATHAANAVAVANGARVLRVHDVAGAIATLRSRAG